MKQHSIYPISSDCIAVRACYTTHGGGEQGMTVATPVGDRQVKLVRWDGRYMVVMHQLGANPSEFGPSRPTLWHGSTRMMGRDEAALVATRFLVTGMGTTECL